MSTPYQPHGSADDFLMGGGVKSASFDGNPPITWQGTIVEFGKQQKRNFDSNGPEFWADGRPKEVLRVTLQTDVRDATDAEDDGQRAIYLEYKKAWAVRDAVKAAGETGLKEGGHLSLTWTHGGERQAGGKVSPKEYSAVYQPVSQWDNIAPPPPTPIPREPVPTAQVDPQVAAFLTNKGVNPQQMEPGQARMIAQTLGYTQ